MDSSLLHPVYLDGSESCDLWGPRAGGKARVEGVDVEAEVNWAAAHLSPDLGHERSQRSEPALFCLDHTETLRRVQTGEVCEKVLQDVMTRKLVPGRSNNF